MALTCRSGTTETLGNPGIITIPIANYFQFIEFIDYFDAGMALAVDVDVTLHGVA